MHFAIWVAIALVCFILPATALTSGGKKDPERGKLADYARSVGLPLTEPLVAPVVARIKRRQRGMIVGGITGLVVATIVQIVFLTDADYAWFGPLVILCTSLGTAFGGAWAIISHRPSAQAHEPVVARLRQVELSDYLTRGERIGIMAVPVATTVGAVAGAVILWLLPATTSMHRLSFGLVGAGLTLLAWVAAFVALRQVLAAAARSASDLELAWDDAERADGLRHVANLAIATACLSLLLWLMFIAEVLTADGFYRANPTLTYVVTGVALVVFVSLIVAVAAGPISAWISGSRKGHEQRQLWPNGVAV